MASSQLPYSHILDENIYLDHKPEGHFSATQGKINFITTFFDGFVKKIYKYVDTIFIMNTFT